jgi:1,4-dihydroxy-2-naphthoate octaprenyltransferase
VSKTHKSKPKLSEQPANFGDWVSASRPATLGLAIAPVVLGYGVGHFGLLLSDQPEPENQSGLIALLCAAVAIFLQIGVNFANDYSDGIRGTDENRSGPKRLTASGVVPAKQVRSVAFAFFGFAALSGLALTLISQVWWLPIIGLFAITAAWYYTGGKRPYGYSGFGEIAVFLFFGIVATSGTSFLVSGFISLDAVLAGATQGLFAAAVLHINNLRDRENDLKAGKRTLATRISPLAGKWFFAVLILLPFVSAALFSVYLSGAPLVFLCLFSAIPAVLISSTAKTPRELVLALKLTVLTSFAYCCLLAMAFAL